MSKAIRAFLIVKLCNRAHDPSYVYEQIDFAFNASLSLKTLRGALDSMNLAEFERLLKDGE